MCVYVCMYIHTYPSEGRLQRFVKVHARMYVYNTYKQAHKHTYIHTYIHTCTHVFRQVGNILVKVDGKDVSKLKHTYIHTYIHIYTHVFHQVGDILVKVDGKDVSKLKHTYIHTYMHTYTHFPSGWRHPSKGRRKGCVYDRKGVETDFGTGGTF